jgi:hypothetical protein
MSRAVLIAALLPICSTIMLGQVESVTLSEPATVKIDDLFKQADLVAVVKVLSGDSEHYAITVYKAEVLNAFKGAANSDRIYFGPFINYGVGSEYLVFLRKSKEEFGVSRNADSPGLTYGTVTASYHVMYDGYSTMPVKYACVFDEKGSKEPCDYGVKINTYQVKLPKRLKTYPIEPTDADMSDARWVRRRDVVSMLETLR